MQPWKMFIPWMWTMHLLGAVWLSAGVLASVVIFSQMKRTDGDLAGRVFGLRLASRLMSIFVVPGVILTGALGFYLLHAFRIYFLPGWVQLSVALWAVMLLGILFVQWPQVRRVRRAAEASLAAGAPTPELQQAQSRKLPAILNHVNATLIFILILLMALKPPFKLF